MVGYHPVEVQADYVVIGGGIAGLRALADLVGTGDILLLTKAGPTESNTGYAQGGIAAALGADDSPALHLTDTLTAGAGLCDETAVEVLVHEGPQYVRQLLEWGVAFDLDADGQPSLGREGAHSVRRVLHARDATGREIARALWARVHNAQGLRTWPDTLATDVIVEQGTCRGVRFLAPDGTRALVRAPAVLLATGGAGQIFRETTNPQIATGDGVAMAWRAGARVGDLEFVQFHPTVLSTPAAPRFLLSEALRGEGARLVNDAGERFMERYDRAGELAARDVVATAIVREQQRTGHPVYLSLGHLDPDRVHARFPTIAEVCARAGLDLGRDLLPVSPAAHYMCGGVETDLAGRTSIPGLFAAGEVACTGVHGANRLASNSLLEGLVFGARAAVAMRGPQRPTALRPATDAREYQAVRPHQDPHAIAIPDVLWQQAGLLRDASGLARAVETTGSVSAALEQRLDDGASGHDWRAASIALVGHLVARAALRRQESRGGHRRTDFPDQDDLHWKIHLTERRRPEGVR
jgi:L-aspartate oxidase